MAYTMKIEGNAAGGKSDFDGQYVVEYDPSLHLPGGEYDGGLLRTSVSLLEAKKFKDLGELFEYYGQSYGTRPDGKPNKPLTAFNIEVKAV